MNDVRAPYRSSVGKKFMMAATGAVLILFVFGHMFGNLKVYQGAEAFNHYAEGLRTVGAPFFGRGQLLWLIRGVLLLCVVTHIVAATQLTLHSRRARAHGYRQFDSLALSYASRTMVWGGIVILGFVIYHLLHMTFGTVHPDFIAGDAYHNFVVGFSSLPVSLAYITAMLPLGLHLYHGIWSAFQTVGTSGDRIDRFRRPLAALIAGAVVLANISFPLAVLTGVLQ